MQFLRICKRTGKQLHTIIRQVAVAVNEILFRCIRRVLRVQDVGDFLQLKNMYSCLLLVIVVNDEALQSLTIKNIHAISKAKLRVFRIKILLDCQYVDHFNRDGFYQLLQIESDIQAYVSRYQHFLQLQQYVDKHRGVGLWLRSHGIKRCLHWPVRRWLAACLVLLLLIIMLLVGFSAHQTVAQQLKSLDDDVHYLQLPVMFNYDIATELQLFYQKHYLSLQTKRYIDPSQKLQLLMMVQQWVVMMMDTHYHQQFMVALRRELSHDHNHAQHWLYHLLNIDTANQDNLQSPIIIQQWQQLFNRFFSDKLNYQFIQFYLLGDNHPNRPYLLLSDDSQLHLGKLSPQLYYDVFKMVEIQHYGYIHLYTLLGKQHLLDNQQALPAFYSIQYLSAVKQDLRQFVAYIQHHYWLRQQLSISNELLNSLLLNDYMHDKQIAWEHFICATQLIAPSSLAALTTNLQSLQQVDNPIRQLYQIINANLLVHPSIEWPEYQQKLAEITDQMKVLLMAEYPDKAIINFSQKILQHQRNDFTNMVQSIQQSLETVNDSQLANAYQHLLLLPLRGFWQALLQHDLQVINNKYQTVLRYYRQYCQSFFPFVASTNDASADVVRHFLSPTYGVFWQFIHRQLNGFVSYQQHWQLRSWQGLGLPLSQQFMKNLNALSVLSKVLFKAGQLHVQFSLYPIPNPYVVSQQLTTAHQQLIYENGPQHWQTLNWQQEDDYLQLTLHRVGSKYLYQKRYLGPWAPLRLLTDQESRHKRLRLLLKPHDLDKILLSYQQANALELNANDSSD